MQETSGKISYFIYARKSSEKEDRQVLSIPSQINEMTAIAKHGGYSVTAALSEAYSAKAPGRKVFNQMVKDIEEGKVQGIIAWHADRLSRNSVDAGWLVYLMDIGKLREIVTPTQVFHNTPNDKAWFNMLCIQAKLENDNKGVNVKRGLKAKCEIGIYPSRATVGYINDKYAERGNKKHLRDPERFDATRRMFDLMLTGTYNPDQIRRIATDEWGFRTKDGKKLSRSTMYYMFSRPFYYGMFEYPVSSGNWYKGSHEPMITEEEYDRIQLLLGRRGKPRPKTHVFDFTGMMRCGECGAAITAEEKTKRQQNGNVHSYIYYHCTKRVDPSCKQGSIEAKALKSQIVEEIMGLEIPPEFHEFAIKWFREGHEKDAAGRNAILSTQQRAYALAVKKIDGLVDMRAAGEISPELFAQKSNLALKEKHRLEELLADTGQQVEKFLGMADETLTFVESAIIKFNTGGLEIRKQILSTLGSNLILKDKKLNIDLDNTLIPMKSIAKEVADIHRRLEPRKTPIKQGDLERLYATNPIVLRD